MEDHRPIPNGWIKQWDSNHQCHYYVDIHAQPPRSIWTHPYDDPIYQQQAQGHPSKGYAPPDSAHPSSVAQGTRYGAEKLGHNSQYAQGYPEPQPGTSSNPQPYPQQHTQQGGLGRLMGSPGAKKSGLGGLFSKLAGGGGGNKLQRPQQGAYGNQQYSQQAYAQQGYPQQQQGGMGTMMGGGRRPGGGMNPMMMMGGGLLGGALLGSALGGGYNDYDNNNNYSGDNNYGGGGDDYGGGGDDGGGGGGGD